MVNEEDSIMIDNKNIEEDEDYDFEEKDFNSEENEEVPFPEAPLAEALCFTETKIK